MKEYRTPSVYAVGPASECIKFVGGPACDGEPAGQPLHELASKLEE
jgi:hypothetical protein